MANIVTNQSAAICAELSSPQLLCGLDHVSVYPGETSTASNELLSEEQTILILQILIYGVVPTVSLFGIVGNIFSVLILRSHGLHKSSNIILMTLAISDIIFLVGFNSVPKLLYDVVGDAGMYTYSYDLSYLLYILYNVFNVLDYGSLGVSFTLPAMITLERLTAVFLPLKFPHIVTPQRTWTLMVITNLFWYSFFIHMTFLLEFSFEFAPQVNMTVGLIKRSRYHHTHVRTVEILEELMSYLMMKIPAIATLAGSLVIGFKIKMVSLRRKKLTSKKWRPSSSAHTTKVLLGVCTMFTITSAIMSLPTFLPQYMYYTVTSDAPSNLSKVMYHVMNLVVCFNCSCNFIIYVVLNQNFRVTFRRLIQSCLRPVSVNSFNHALDNLQPSH